jgi:hypothetical protein
MPDTVDEQSKSMTMGGLIPDLVLRATEGTSRRWTADARHTRPFSQKGSRGVDKWLAEPDPPSKNGIRMGGPGSDLYRGLSGGLVELDRLCYDDLSVSSHGANNNYDNDHDHNLSPVSSQGS